MVNQHIFIGDWLRQKIQMLSDTILAGARGHVLLSLNLSEEFPSQRRMKRVKMKPRMAATMPVC
jgi:hypothetical protein